MTAASMGVSKGKVDRPQPDGGAVARQLLGDGLDQFRIFAVRRSDRDPQDGRLRLDIQRGADQAAQQQQHPQRDQPGLPHHDAQAPLGVAAVHRTEDPSRQDEPRYDVESAQLHGLSVSPAAFDRWRAVVDGDRLIGHLNHSTRGLSAK